MFMESKGHSNALQEFTIRRGNYSFTFPISSDLSEKIKNKQYRDEFDLAFAEVSDGNMSILSNNAVQIQELKSLPDTQIRQRKRLAGEIYSTIGRLKSIFTNKHPILSEAYRYLLGIISPYNDDAFLEFMECITKHYFEEYYREQFVNSTILPKQKGAHRGILINIEYQESKDDKTIRNILYYVKTHHFGSTRFSGKGSSRRLVDTKELFTYKLFEYMGLGPKVHFILEHSNRELLIATQELKNIAYFQNITQFQVPDKQYDLKSTDENLNDAQKDQYYVDILSKMFHLGDLLDNDKNVGYVTETAENTSVPEKQLKIIDFGIDFKMHDENELYEIIHSEEYFNIIQTLIDKCDRRDQSHQSESGVALSFIDDAIVKAFNDVLATVRRYVDCLKTTQKKQEYLTEQLGDLAEIIDHPINAQELLNQLTLKSYDQLGELGRYIKSIRENFEFLRNVTPVSQNTTCPKMC